MKNKLMILFMAMFLLNFVSAATETYKVNTEINLKLTCTIDGSIPSNISTMNLTVSYPNGTLLINNQPADARGNGIFNYTLTFPEVGTYYPTLICVDGTLSNSDSSGSYIITPSGSLMNDGDSLVFFSSLLIMIIVSSVFLYTATKAESIAPKVTLYTISFIGYLMSVLYAVVTVQQVFFGFESIVNGFETFLFVGKIGVFLGFIALMIVVLLVMLKAWKIKRGFDD